MTRINGHLSPFTAASEQAGDASKTAAPASAKIDRLKRQTPDHRLHNRCKARPRSMATNKAARQLARLVRGERLVLNGRSSKANEASSRDLNYWQRERGQQQGGNPEHDQDQESPDETAAPANVKVFAGKSRRFPLPALPNALQSLAAALRDSPGREAALQAAFVESLSRRIASSAHQPAAPVSADLTATSIDLLRARLQSGTPSAPEDSDLSTVRRLLIDTAELRKGARGDAADAADERSKCLNLLLPILVLQQLFRPSTTKQIEGGIARLQALRNGFLVTE